MPTVLRNGRTSTSTSKQSTSSAPRAATSSPSSSPTVTSIMASMLPSPPLLLLLYPALLILGFLFSILSPVAGPQPAADASPHQHPQANYFAGKRNIFNVFFVKIGWVWTTLAFVALVATTAVTTTSSASSSASSSARSKYNVDYARKALARYGLVTLSWILTTQWFFGPPLIDRSFTITGGQCHAPSSPPTASISAAVASSAACKAAGGRWHGGHDISGHIFMLSLASAFLIYELYIAGGQPRSSAEEAQETSESLSVIKLKSELRKYSHYLAWAVVGLSLWMFLMTSIWFHTWQEKVSGLVLAEATIWAVYFLPDWVPALKGINPWSSP